ncbi:LTA synthase family protein [Dyella mobilis]|uniref:Sulfatase-like hydrolase/transferase n=1 Tax=Dyella mobilis TaxID=1849582 RepID=A0ABS2KC25_9GAMM|nr:sulfatase-like hydrolase/transferase [Dyella mobilis]MBM7128585.1 sulfatase-like hydrolase/transferase [Dyella mobilis]
MSLTFSSHSSLRERFRPLWWLGIVYVILGAITRVALLLMTGKGVPHDPADWLYAFGVGFCSDLITLLYVAWPLLLFLWIVPSRRPLISTAKQWLLYVLVLAALYALALYALHLAIHAAVRDVWPVIVVFLFFLPLPTLCYDARSGQRALYILCLLTLFGLLFVAASELVFWNEFGVRFNFIAVDYLVYTTEVVDNIRESYPIGLWLGMLAATAIVILLLSRRALRTRDHGTRFAQRSKVVAVWAALTAISLIVVDSSSKDRTENTYVNELAGNGIYQFFAAFRSSHLDYDRFYRTLPLDQAFARVRAQLKTPDATYVSDNPRDLTREIRHPGPEQHLNVVLISVESLSADFLKTFGASHGDVTPHLDALVRQSLFFDHLYANGTRTVRGLEALSMSIPPTPGDSILKQANNEDMLSLGRIFDQHGYVSQFVYGGYGYFDNMNYFFGHNGYQIVDRSSIPKEMPIHGQNVWGVADEDLYTLALTQMDAIHAQGKPFFLHIMTTSNHRPFTFPAGRVSERNGTREGAIAYTDWSIADFIQRARSKPYFDDTVFVITADHCASSAGRSSIPIDRYHIPLWIYAPKHFAPRRISTEMAQIDIPTTLLGLLNFSYRSRFFGYDVFQLTPGQERAFPATYEKLGYLHGKLLSILEPQRKVEQVFPDFETGDATPVSTIDQDDLDNATADYQVASYLFKHRLLARQASDATTVAPVPAPAGSAPAPASSSSTLH